MLDDAVEIANAHGTRGDKDRLLITQAQAAFEQENYQLFETALLKCEKPEIGVRMYKVS